MATYNVISADSHVSEPPDLFTSYIDPAFRSRAPRLIRDGNADKWQMEGVPLRSIGLQTAAGKPSKDLSVDALYEDGPRGGWDPKARIQDMELDGVDAEVLYTSLFPLYRLPDWEYQMACVRAYNDWLADMCGTCADRLFGIAVVPLDHVEDAVVELRRVAKKGLRGVVVCSSPPGDRPFSDPSFDPFWAEAAELRMPVSLHMFSAGSVRRPSTIDGMAFDATAPMEIQEALATLISGGVPERYPELKLVSVEAGIGWIPTFLDRMDRYFERHYLRAPDRPKLAMRPSEYFRRQMFATFMVDRPGVETRHHIGVGNIMWSSDYPHSNSTWPESRNVIDSQFGDVPEEDRRRVVCDNAVGLYRLA